MTYVTEAQLPTKSNFQYIMAEYSSSSSSLSSSFSLSSSSSQLIGGLATTGPHSVILTSTLTSTQFASTLGPPVKDMEDKEREKEKKLHPLPPTLKSSSRFSSAGLSSSSSSSTRIRQSVIAEGLLNHDFFLSHVAAYLDPFSRKCASTTKIADVAKDSIVPLLFSEATVASPSIPEASTLTSLSPSPTPSSPLPPLSLSPLPPLPKGLKSTGHQGSDLLNLSILSKAFNEAVISNEPIWQNILRNLMAPTLTIALPCNVLIDKTAFYKFVLSKIKGFETYQGMRDFIAVTQNKRSQTAVTYSGFLSKRSSLKSILQIAEKGLRSSFSCLLPQDQHSHSYSNSSSASNSKSKTATCMVCTSVESIEGSLLDLLDVTDQDLNKNLFPSFDQISTHGFSAACKKCSFRIDVTVDSLKNVCECDLHDELIEDLSLDGEDQEDLVIKVCENNFCCGNLYCQYCSTDCAEEGCAQVMCLDCDSQCDFCDRGPLCGDHYFICSEFHCQQQNMCIVCVKLCAICDSSSCEEHIIYCDYCSIAFCSQHENNCCDSCGKFACGRNECIAMGSHPQLGSQIQLCATGDCGTSICETCANDCDNCLKHMCREHSQFCERCPKFYCESCAVVTRDEVTKRADKSLSTCSICNPNRHKHLITDYFGKK